ncbi:TPA: ArdC family protein, partial [Serratia marcescens]
DKKKGYEKKENTKDHRQELTDRLIESIENAGSWEKPWFTCPLMPRNISTGKQYKGINVISLMSAGYDNPDFGTYNHWGELEDSRQNAHKDLITIQSKFQAGELSSTVYVKEKNKVEKVFEDLEKKGMVDRNEPIHVKKGEKGIAVFKAIQMEFQGKNDGADQDGEQSEDGSKKVWVQVYAGTVFNARQVANISPSLGPTYEFEPHAEADLHVQAMIAKTGLTVEHNDGGRAFYSVNQHKVSMPHKEKFVPGAYYDTLLHELGHSTGPALGRDLSGSFGSAKYAYEELVAELSSVFMSAELGIPHNPSVHENHAAYLKSWLGALKQDKNMIFKAASHAQKSADFQNMCRQEYKLELAQTLTNQAVQEQTQTPVLSLSTPTQGSPALKREKQLVISM